MAYLMRNGMKISHHAFSQSSIAGCSGLDRYNEQWPEMMYLYDNATGRLHDILKDHIAFVERPEDTR